MNAPIFKYHAALLLRSQVTDDSKHSGSATTRPAYSCRRIRQRRRRFPSSAEPTENSPARNRPEAQDPRRNRRPFPAKPPRSRGDAPAGEAAAADVHAGMLIGSICPCSQTNACAKRTANHRAKTLMENASRTPYPPLQKATLSHPRQPTKKVTHNYQKSPWRSVIPRFSIVKCRQQISHDNTVPCVAKPSPATREVTP